MKKRVGRMRCLLFLSILFLTLIQSRETAKAGDIDLPEADLIQFLHGTFEHNGSVYKVKEAYISKAESYMKRDDINLTSEDKRQAISMFYENFQQGIDEGYLEVVLKEEKNDDIQQKTEMDTNKDNEKDKTKDDQTGTDELEGKQNKDGNNGDGLSIIEQKAETETEDKIKTASKKDVEQNKDKVTDDILGLGITMTEEKKTSDHEGENSNQPAEVKSPEENKKVIDHGETMIKRTGFNHAPIKRVFVLLGCFYVILVGIVIYRNRAAKMNGPN